MVLSEAGPRAAQALIKLGSPFQVGALPGPGPPPLLRGRLTNCSRRVGRSAETVMGEVPERRTSYQVALKPRSLAPS